MIAMSIIRGGAACEKIQPVTYDKCRKSGVNVYLIPLQSRAHMMRIYKHTLTQILKAKCDCQYTDLFAPITAATAAVDIQGYYGV